jgi:hypothetical protein
MNKLGLLSTTVFSCALVLGCQEDGMGTGGSGATKTSDDTQGMSNTGAAETTGDAPTGTASGVDPASTGGGTGTGAIFLNEKDGGIGDKQCDPWMQDCPEGEKCMPYSGDGDNSWESLKCVPVMENAGAVGDKCTVEGGGTSGVDSCQKAAMCWSVDPDTGEGTCIQQCKGVPDAPMCPEGTFCVNANGGVLTVCLPGCDPLLQDCEGTDLCLPNPEDSNSFICVIDASGEEGQEWDACEYGNACDKGMICANAALATECDPQSSGCCLPFCDLTMPACKGANQECLTWYEPGMAPPGLEDVGLCGLPQ